MKKLQTGILTLILSIALSACGQLPAPNSVDSSSAISYETESQEAKTLENSSETVPLPSSQETFQVQPKENVEPDNLTSEITFSIDDVASYSGQPYVAANNNVPYFPESELTTESFEIYSDLDNLGRCGVAYANICIDIMPTEEREEIGQIKPSGWHTVKHNGIIDGNYLYNRCHLIAYQLAGENANEKNLITGTRYLNTEGMLPFENMVADYVKETGNHVLYRVTPIFEGENLVASGVLMEAESVEDKGEDIQFCVYVYNVQPGIAIDYLTGESSLVKDSPVTQTEEAPKPQIQEETQTVPQTAPEANAPSDVETPQVTESEPQGTAYILNTNTKKFHYPSCSSVNQMKDKNKQAYTGNREDVISQGYAPCKRCNP